MGFWTGIKHALNSTVGTREFQPLDKIIKGQRTLAPADSVLAVISSGSIKADNSENKKISGASFTPFTSGAVRLFFHCEGTASSSYPETPEIHIYEDGISVGSVKGDVFTSGFSVDVYGDFAIKVGKKYEFYLDNDNYASHNLTYSNIKINGTIIDGSLFDYTVGAE